MDGYVVDKKKRVVFNYGKDFGQIVSVLIKRDNDKFALSVKDHQTGKTLLCEGNVEDGLIDCTTGHPSYKKVEL